MPITPATTTRHRQRGFLAPLLRPTLAEQAQRELDQTRRRKLQAESAREYADAAVQECSARIARLTMLLETGELDEREEI